jgi:hypothetical protein
VDGDENPAEGSQGRGISYEDGNPREDYGQATMICRAFSDDDQEGPGEEW